MKIPLLNKSGENIIKVFSGWNLAWHLIAALSTYLLITSGADWAYFQATLDPTIQTILFPSVLIGLFGPILFPLAYLYIGKKRKDIQMIATAWALGQAVFLGWLISTSYKVFTGRGHPLQSGELLADISHQFHFGVLRGGIFWGWPSSHTAVAFSLAAAFWILHPNRKVWRVIVAALALYIGIGVSGTVHWLSDFVAGAIIGIIVGNVVGESFLRKDN
jgi:membrane-associated phospholipid phosphatase